MKISEEKVEIRKLANEYAISGQYSGWLPIEHQLRFSDGLEEARHKLDNTFLRDHLDTLCKIARSEEEKNREKSFQDFLVEKMPKFEIQFKNSFPDIEVFHDKDSITVKKTNKTYFIKRRFGNSNLEYTNSFKDSSGHESFTQSSNKIENSDTSSIDYNKLSEIIQGLSN